ncbi:uncharacterized protein TNCV_405681 [Trichonephila clavipes]|nr:uncharacterized protein TNCV_405681 [Trichonephila clavipes]
MRISHKRLTIWKTAFAELFADIRPQMLEKVIENWTSRLDYIRTSRGSHVPEIIFKIAQNSRNKSKKVNGTTVHRWPKPTLSISVYMTLSIEMQMFRSGGQSDAMPVFSSQEAKTRHRVSLVSAHVTTLEEDLKQQPLCQDRPKDVLSDSGLEIELAIPFVPNRDPPDTPQQSELGEVVHYHPSE